MLGELRASGAEVMLKEALPEFRRRGFEPSVLSTGEVVGSYGDEFRKLDVPVLHEPFARNLGYAMSFYRLLRRERPAVVHVHTERANAALCLLGRLSGARVVRTVHSVFSYTGRLRRLRTLERATLRLLGVRHIAIGRAVEENEKSRLRNATTRVDNWIGDRFCPPNTDQRRRARQVINLPQGALVVASVGNCSPVKNHQAILHALPEAARQLGRPIVYCHAGTGADEAAERTIAEHLHAPVSVRFLGTVRDVVPILWASDCFCMPSLYEGLSIAALEAIACGVPCVLADVAGLRAVHSPAPVVCFVEPDATGVASGIIDVGMLDPESKRQQMRTVANKICATHNASRCVKALSDVYRGN